MNAVIQRGFLSTHMPATLFHAGNGYWIEDRWGDNSFTSVDPDDSMTFWTVQEYATAVVDEWGTWIAKIKR